MSFSSLLFIFYFLPVFLLIYYASRESWRNSVLIVTSALFYFWLSPEGAIVIFVSIGIDYLLCSLMMKNAGARKKLFLVLNVIFNLAILFYFKYSNFFIDQVNTVLSLAGSSAIPWKNIIFPAGISFIIFHKISYAVDIYYGTVSPAENVFKYISYIFMFPKVLQGPIIRYKAIADQLSYRSAALDDIVQGAFRFCIGLAKKVLVADLIGITVDAIFNLPHGSLSASYAWFGVICYMFQIYFDFSGYTDMAIGIARMIGFTFPENFDWPFTSRSFTEFWTRWHITLTDWFKQYVYIPLGGNRVSTMRNYINLWSIFFLSALWHGANWTFVVWGLYNGFFIFIEKIFLLKWLKKLPGFLQYPLFLIVFWVGLVYFRAETIQKAWLYMLRMFDVTRIVIEKPNELPVEIISTRGIAVLLIVSVLHMLYPGYLKPLWQRIKAALTPVQETAGMIVITIVLLTLTFAFMINNKFMPFIYFRF